MEIVIDANVLISALIKDGFTRHFIGLSNHSFYVPEFIFQEIHKHLEEIKKKSILDNKSILELLQLLIDEGNIKIVSFSEFDQYRDMAQRISPDPDDVHYLALALKLNCIIWSNDKALRDKQNIVRVYNTEQILQSEFLE